MHLKSIIYLLLLIIISSCAGEKEVKVLKLGHTLDTKHPVHLAMEYFGERLKEKSNGKLTLQIYPSAQLGAERECLELLQIGSLDVTKVSAAVLENFIPEYKVFSIPYLFKDRQHSFNVYDGQVGKDVLQLGDKFKLQGLTFYDAGSRSFYTKENPVNTPADLKNLKIRVQKSNMAVAMVNDLGGAPTPISYGELYTALQQGVVDGAENNLPSFYTSKHFEVCPYYSMDEHTAVPDVLLISLDTWERLDEQERKCVQAAADESTIKERELWAASEQESLEAIKKAGVEVNYPDKAPFEEATRGIYKTFENEPGMLTLIERIQAEKK